MNFLGQGCVGVYLIHNNRNLSHFLWETLKINYWLVERKNILITLFLAIMVFLLCNLIEHLREYVFEKLHINEIIVKVANKLTNYIDSKQSMRFRMPEDVTYGEGKE